MANLNIYTQADMRNLNVFYGTVSSYSSDHISLSSYPYFATYYGSFKFSKTGLSGGTMTGYKHWINGKLAYEVTDTKVSATTVNKYLNNSDGNSVQSYVLSGHDIINGSIYSDYIKSWAGNDAVNGNQGSDTLEGGLGADTLTGGKDADVFKYTAVKESGTTATTRDTLTDFKHTENDLIDLSAIDANSKISGNQSFQFIGSASFNKDATGQLRFDSATHILYASTNADSKPEFSILLTGVEGLVAEDFIL